ncbi:glutamate racemase [Spongiibacter sp. KMU-158]|uniref:Glutamate racemase n=1 Tax=Spongiibacter pelagi TaxID=2760804 RepID=A0A927GVS2_9GAMM|nr:glutamate racemase [Spongiibacter pelagi]MBD2857674.1 glutamate racemase [Spongiibacter pelagi]
MSTTPRILVFDSGVGSLSIGAEIHALLPHVDLLYAMDRGGFPYGQWQQQALVEHICLRIEQLLAEHSVDMLVVACNSASTAVLPALREQLSIPVVGVVPAIKPAALLSQTKVIGLLATPGTVARPYTAELIREFAADCCVISVGAAELAPAIEDFFWTGNENAEQWQASIDALCKHPRANEMDTVILACTHFPLIQSQLSERLPGKQWIDSGKAIARRVAHLLTDKNLPHQNEPGQQTAVILGEQASDSLRQNLAERGISLLS